MIERAKDMFHSIRKKGAFLFLGSGILSKVLTFLSNIMIVRILSKDSYGIVSYAIGITQVIMLFSNFGMDTVVLQYTPEEENRHRKVEIYKFSLQVGILINVLTMLLIVYMCRVLDSQKIILQLALLPLLNYIYTFFLAVYRAEFNNKVYSLVVNVHTFSNVFFIVGLSYLWGIKGYVIGNYIGYIVPIVISIYINSDIIKKFICRSEIPLWQGFEYLKYGGFVVACNAASQILYHMDTVFVGAITNVNTTVADYKAAASIPTALTSLSTLLCTFIYPYFVKHRTDKQWVYSKWKKILAFTFPGYLLIGVFGIVFSKPILGILYGNAYIEADVCFAILMVSFIISSSFRVLSGNVLAMLRLVKINFFFSIIESVGNIILDVILIRKYGSIGAALATTFVVMLSSVMSTLYLVYYCKKSGSNRYENKVSQ